LAKLSKLRISAVLEVEIKYFKEFAHNFSVSISFKPVEYLLCKTIWTDITAVLAANRAASSIYIFYEFFISEIASKHFIFLGKPYKNFIAYTIRAKRVEYPLIADDAQAIVEFLNHFRSQMHKQAMKNSLPVTMTVNFWHSCSYPENPKSTTNPSFV